jgi:transposase
LTGTTQGGPAGQWINSPYDLEATFGNKRTTTWTGNKVQVAVTCEPGQVHLITDVRTSPAVSAGVDLTAPIQAGLAEKDLRPWDYLLDAGSLDGEFLVSSRTDHGVRLVGPVRPNVSWQTQANQGLDVAHFTSVGQARSSWIGLQGIRQADPLLLELPLLQCRKS